MLKKILAVILSVSMLSTIVSAAEFSDVGNHWAAGEIQYGVDNGIISGYPDGTFRPNETISRAGFVKMLVSSIAENYDVEISRPGSGEHWVSRYYSFAVAQSILMPQYGVEHDGVEAAVLTTETVDNKIKRWEMAYMLYCVLANLMEKGNWYDGYVDFEETKNLYGEDMAYFIGACVDGGLLHGDQNGRLNAASDATRAEAITVVNRVDRMLKQMKK